MKLLLHSLLVVLFLSSCNSEEQKTSSNPNLHAVIVKEAIQAGQYTYLKVEENDTEKWIAVPAMQPEIGKTYFYEGGMEMTNFKSKELNRTFESVFFVDRISTDTIKAEASQPQEQMAGAHKNPQAEKKQLSVQPAPGAIRIADLFKNKTKYVGKKVKITGEVVKFNEAIMDKNWIHLQDGSDFEGAYDVTVTSQMVCKVGDVITIEGVVAVDKDFGHGYVYKLIVEEAEIVK